MSSSVYIKTAYNNSEHNVVVIKIKVYTKMFKTLTGSLCTIDECFTNIAVCKHARGTNIVPILTRERVDAENTKYNILKKRSKKHFNI